MNYQYVCPNKICVEKEGLAFQLEFPPESIIDDNNIATLFCHKCGESLIKEQQPIVPKGFCLNEK